MSSITASLNAESNLAVSTLLAKSQNRIKANRKRLRNEFNDSNTAQSPSKKRKIDPLTIQNDTENNNSNNAFGFSSDDDNEEEGDSDNINENDELKQEEEYDDEFDIDIFNNANNNNNNNRNKTDLNDSNNSLQNDPYWNMMQSIHESKNNLMDFDDMENQKNNSNNSNHSNNKNNDCAGVSIQIDVDKSSMFNVLNGNENKTEDKNKNKKKAVKKYQKWQRDQGIECTRAHLALLIYRARFRALLCTDYELISRMMSLLPLHLHPCNDTFNGMYTEITFLKLRALMRWFMNTFEYDDTVPQFELKCKNSKDRLSCGIFQLIEYIEQISDGTYKMKCSISHLNMLFLALLWSFNIPARMVYVLRPIGHTLTANKIFENNYTDIMDKYFVSKPCVCQQLDEDIEMSDAYTNDTNNKNKNIKSEVHKRQNSGNLWDVNDDRYLYNNRDNEVSMLAKHFSRTNTAIRNRLEHILDPTHDAYKQLHGKVNVSIQNDNDKSVPRRQININMNDMDIDSDESLSDHQKHIVKKKPKKTSGKKEKLKRANSNSKWSVRDDIYLWEYRDDPIHTLAQLLNRTKTGIKMRLETLRNKSSKPRKRLVKNLPANSKSKKLLLNHETKSINNAKTTNHKRPDFNYLRQNFIYNKNKGSMVECIEVYVSDRKEWVHVLLDRGRIHINLSENNLHQCDCERTNNKINYCVAIDKYGCVNDVTAKYAETWSVALKNRVMHHDFYNDILTKWRQENEQISYQYQWQYILQHKLWKDILLKDTIQINKCIQAEPIPKSEGMFRNHPLYVIDKFLKKYETIYPKDESQVIGKIKGKNVYSIKNLRDLHTRQRWYKLGYVVKENETYVKQVKTSHMSKSDSEFTDLFGKWQCKNYIAPKIGPNDKLPVNERGNIELWSDLHLPIGCVNIQRTGAVSAAKRMKIEYAKAMVGFDQRKGRSIPVFDGIVIHKSYANELSKIIDEMDIKRKEREKEKEMKIMCGLWRMLVQGIIVQQQLQTQAREKEANKKIVTTKEFNAMMNKDNVEEL